MPISRRKNFAKYAIGIRRAWFAKGNRAKRARRNPGRRHRPKNNPTKNKNITAQNIFQSKNKIRDRDTKGLVRQRQPSEASPE